MSFGALPFNALTTDVEPEIVRQSDRVAARLDRADALIVAGLIEQDQALDLTEISTSKPAFLPIARRSWADLGQRLDLF